VTKRHTTLSVKFWIDVMRGGDIRQDQHVIEEFDKVKSLSGYDLKDLQALSDSFVTV